MKKKPEKMDNILELDLYRERRSEEKEAKLKCRPRTVDVLMKAQTIEKLTLQIDNLLENKARDEGMPDAVAMAAGRYAVMHLYQKHGLAQTVAFFEDCVQTAEICDDILAQLDDELV